MMKVMMTTIHMLPSVMTLLVFRNWLRCIERLPTTANMDGRLIIHAERHIRSVVMTDRHLDPLDSMSFFSYSLCLWSGFQPNKWTDTWADFWDEHRLGHMLKLCKREGADFANQDALRKKVSENVHTLHYIYVASCSSRPAYLEFIHQVYHPWTSNDCGRSFPPFSFLHATYVGS